MVLGDLYYFYAVYCWALLSFVDNHFLVFLRDQDLSLIAIQKHRVVTECVNAKPPNFAGGDETKLNGGARPIISEPWWIDIVSALVSKPAISVREGFPQQTLYAESA